MSLSGNDLMGLVGQTVKVNRGGPDSVEGVLLSVQNNYMAVWEQDKKMVYVNNAHVKSITASSKSRGVQSQQGGGSQSGGSRSGGMRSGGVQSAMAKPLQAYNFAALLQSLQNGHVQINRGGPEKLEGTIIRSNQNYLMLDVKGEEVVLIPILHIKSVTVLGSSSNNSKGSNSGGNHENNKSGGNKTIGNRTGGLLADGGNLTNGNRTGGNRTIRGHRNRKGTRIRIRNGRVHRNK